MRFRICKTTPANNKNRMMIWQQLIRMLYSFPSPKTYQGMMRYYERFMYFRTQLYQLKLFQQWQNPRK